MNQMFFYHGQDLMQILEISQIVGFVVNYLHPVPLFGEGNGNPLQYSCLETPMDGGV